MKNDRIVCEVKLEKEAPRYTDPALIAHLCETFPNLPKHTCKNALGTCFAAVMDHTSIPHLFEHLVIDLQARGHSHGTMTFVGTTEWLDAQEDTARIEVNFTDDLSALRAFRDAAQILNKAMI